MAHVLGVDAGNSKTVALVAALDGQVVGAGRSGCGDISNRAVGVEAALANVAAAAGAALAAAGLARDGLAATAFGMAGADWPEDVAFLAERLAADGWGDGPVIVNDAVGALRACSPTGVGVAIVAGTYAVSAARSPAGEVWHAGFWQETGGAAGLGEAALRAAVRAELGIDPPTALGRAVPAALGLASVREVLHARTARGSSLPLAAVAGLARVVLDAAADGDDGARALVRAEGRTLADYALAAARQVGLAGGPFELFLTGGVFRHPSPLLPAAIAERLRELAPGVAPRRAAAEPVVGAALLGLERAGVTVGEAQLERLRAGLADRSLFATG